MFMGRLKCKMCIKLQKKQQDYVQKLKCCWIAIHICEFFISKSHVLQFTVQIYLMFKDVLLFSRPV